MQPLFQNDLLYFTPIEEQQMQQIGEQLEFQHQALLLGDPATGKSVMAFTIATQLEAKGYQVYYWSLASENKTLWEEIEASLSCKVLFIIDDCHLEIDIATELYFKFHHLPNVTAALLFISRNLPKKRQQSVQFEWVNFFEELKAVTFKTESYHFKTKVSGIIAKYQTYYQHQQNNHQYRVGDKAAIMRHIRKSLVTLSYYLSLWKDTPVLSHLTEARFLETIYENYFRKFALNPQQIAHLLQYAGLYTFEIEFENLPNDEQTTQLLAEKGLILEVRQHVYAFYHSDFAELLLQAAYEESFQRKYQTFDNFLRIQIKDYLLSFATQSGYPNNMHAILSHIASSQKAFFLEKLFVDDELKRLIVAFYAKKTDWLTLTQFVDVLSKNAPIVFNEYLKDLLDKNKYFKKVFLFAESSFSTYTSILMNLRKNKITYNAFLDHWEEQEPSLIERSGIQYIGIGLRNLQLHINPDKAKQLYDCVDIRFFVSKIQKANLANIGNALNLLNQVNPGNTNAIFKFIDKTFFKFIDKTFFISKIQEAHLQGIGKALNELNHVNPSKTAAIFESVDDAFFISKIQEANLIQIGDALNQLNQVNPNKTAAIFESVDKTLFIPKIQKANLVQISNIFKKLNQVNPNKTAAIVESVDDAFFISKIPETNLVQIGNTLNELSQINPNKTAAIFESLDNPLFIPKIQEANLVDIGNALNELNQLNPNKTATIFENIDNNLLVHKAVELDFIRLANALFELHKVSEDKTQRILKTLQATFTVDKITKEIETIRHEIFLLNIAIFPKLEANFGKLLLQNIDLSYLFQWDKLKNIMQFNRLLNAFHLAEINQEDENIKQLISFAQKNEENFLKSRKLSDMSNFLQLLANYIDIQPLIKQNLNRFVEKIRDEEKQTEIPRFIGIIHANAAESAFYLFEQFKKDYPDAQEIIGLTHYHIGKNYLEQWQPEDATEHLEIAEVIFIDIKHEIGYELVQVEKEQLNLFCSWSTADDVDKRIDRVLESKSMDETSI